MEDEPSNFCGGSFLSTVIFGICTGDVTEPATEEEKDENSIMVELQQTFTAELAHLAYIPFCRLAGGYAIHYP